VRGTTKDVIRLVGAAVLAVFGSAAVSAAGQGDPNQWAPIGPRFSTVLALEHDPFQSSVMLAGTYFGGVYRSSDYGFSWTPVATDFSSASIFSIAFDPVTAGVIYVGTFQSGVFKSSDGGQHWSAINRGLTDLEVQVVAVDRFDSSTLIAATSNGGLFRSTNGGNDWSGVDDAGLGLRGRTIAFDPVRPGVVYLGTIGRGALKSLDHGVTWTSLNAGMRGTSVLSLRFSPASRHSLYAATDNGAYKLLDGASSWTDISFDLPPYPVSDLLPHPTVDNMAFAATIVGDFVMSDDEHATAWTPWDLTPTRLLAVDPSGAVFHRADIHGALDATLDFGANWYQANLGIQNAFIGSLATVAGSSGPIVYAGSDIAVHRNAGFGWETPFDQKQGVFDIQPDPVDANTLYIGTERGGVWKTVDAGANWFPSAGNIVPAQVFALAQSADAKTLIAGTSSGLYLSPNNGEVWVLGNTGSLSIVRAMAADPNRGPILYVGGPGGRVLRSGDGGWSYSQASNGLPDDEIVGLTIAPWEKVYAITGRGGLFATSDDGLNWFPASTGVQSPASALAADPTKPWVLYLGTLGGGVYRSDSGSLTWSQKNAGLPSPYVLSVAVDPSTPSTVYAGSINGLFKTTDSAEHWTAPATGLPAGAVTSLIVDAKNGQVVYASIQDQGVFRSRDGGLTWAKATTGLPVGGAMPIALNPTDGTNLFAGTSLNGVYMTTDSGAHWNLRSFGMTLFVRGVAVDPVTPATVYAGSLGAGVFKSTDAAASWTNVGLRDRNIFKLAVDPKHPQTIYAATSQGVSASRDGGTTWLNLGQRTAFVQSMVVDPRDRRVIYIGSTGGSVYRSGNGGDSWERTSNGLPAFTIFALAIDASSGALYASPEGQGVFKSVDQGASWSPFDASPLVGRVVSALAVDNAHTLYAATVGFGVFANRSGIWELASNSLSSPQIAHIAAGAGVLYASTYDLGVFRSSDGGASWQWASYGLSTSIVSSVTPDLQDSATAYAATPDGVFVTTDSAHTWRPLNSGMVGVPVRAVMIDPFTHAVLYAATNGRGVWKSTDAGATWASASAGLTNLDIQYLATGPTSGALYAGTLGSGFFRSPDGGTTWSGGSNANLTDNFALAIAVNSQAPSTLYAATAGRGVLKSTNSGVDWTSTNNGLGSLFLLSLAIDRVNPETLYAGTSDHGIYVTDDGARSWRPLNDGLFNQVVTSLSVSASDHSVVYAGTEGGGVFRNHVSAAAIACTYGVSPTVISIGSPATTVPVSLTTDSRCGWRAENTADWISLSTPLTGAGAATLSLSVAINIGNQARSATVTVAGIPIVVVQQGLLHLNRLTVVKTGNGSGTVTSDWIGIQCGADCTQLFTDALPVVLTPIANAGSVFVGWSGHPDCVDGAVTMSGDRACTARFDQTDDFDGDGLPDLYELQFGLDPGSATGAGGATGDPDGDGQTNTSERSAATHPRGFFSYFFADAAATAMFTTRLAMFNPGITPTAASWAPPCAQCGAPDLARVLVRLVQADGTVVTQYISVPAKTRRTLELNGLPGLASAAFSIVVESDFPIVVDRTVKWSDPFGAHAESAISAPAKTWYLSDGTTRSPFDLFYVVQNPGADAAHLQVTYLLPSPSTPILKEYVVAAAGRRVIHVSTEDPALAGSDVTAVLTSDVPVTVERTLTLSNTKAQINGPAASSPAFLWFLADGSTGPFIKSVITVFSPTQTGSDVRITYLLPNGGIVQRTHSVPAFGRVEINVEEEDPLLGNTPFSAVVGSIQGGPTVVSRIIWWPGSQADWYEGHASLAAPTTGTAWAVADGEVGKPDGAETYLLIANASAFSGSARVTLYFEDGTSAQRTVGLSAASRTTINVGTQFPEAAWKRFSAVVESVATGTSAPPQIEVERSMYWSPNGIPWAAGSNVVGTRLIP
jgi:photosystem II stability/assembly factor-like uncharacterized protein